jgi:hypothetical protein
MRGRTPPSVHSSPGSPERTFDFLPRHATHAVRARCRCWLCGSASDAAVGGLVAGRRARRGRGAVGTGCEAAAENFAAAAEAEAAGVNVDGEVKVGFLERESMATGMPRQRVCGQRGRGLREGGIGCGRSWFLAVMQLVCGDVYDTYEDLGRREILDREVAKLDERRIGTPHVLF